MISLMVVHNTDRDRHQQYADGQPLNLRNLQPVAMVGSNSMDEAISVVCSGNDWQSNPSVIARLGNCHRASSLGDLLFDAADRMYYLITGEILMPMKLEGECLFLSAS